MNYHSHNPRAGKFLMCRFSRFNGHCVAVEAFQLRLASSERANASENQSPGNWNSLWGRFLSSLGDEKQHQNVRLVRVRFWVLKRLETSWHILRHLETFWDILRHLEANKMRLEGHRRVDGGKSHPFFGGRQLWSSELVSSAAVQWWQCDTAALAECRRDLGNLKKCSISFFLVTICKICKGAGGRSILQ